MDTKKVITQWMEFDIPEVRPRAIEVQLDHGLITTLTGPRRAGKTYLCFQLMRGLLAGGVPKGNILYINFEDDRLFGADAEDLSRLLEAFFELSPADRGKAVYLFLDEIQVVRNWDAWVRRVHDTEKNIRMVLTGSSSKLLSREISTKLRGRVLNTEVYPLSFKEFLRWEGVEYDQKTVSHSKRKPAVMKAFSRYLQQGGYPALMVQDVPRDKVLQGYFESMVLRDVVERHRVKETKRLRILANLLFEATAREVSYSKLAHKLQSLGFSLSKNTVIEYISYFEDAYLFFLNLKYDYSITKQIGSMKKLYCVDNGLLNAVSFRFSENAGTLMENLAYAELRRRQKEVFYHRGRYECDFLIREKGRVVAAVQVTRELGEENEQRELRGLLEAMDAHGLGEGIILTAEQEEERTAAGRKVSVLPLWKWLLG